MILAFACVFSDNMVLQQGLPCPVWGVADAGSRVAVEFGAHRATAVADSAGRWSVTLPALAASA
ncbi:MAG: sialate O-acetylesterase, partial [Planctomycetota bacterium]|nr:sialate O-acetylesterase [Planctomycetota bacterium]